MTSLIDEIGLQVSCIYYLIIRPFNDLVDACSISSSDKALRPIRDSGTPDGCLLAEQYRNAEFL